MKKIIALSIIIAALTTGCGNSVTKEVESTEIIYKETTVCRNGKLIWVGVFQDGYAGGMTSEIIGECEKE